MEPKEKLIATLREFRIVLDPQINSIGLFKPSRELSLAKTNLERAFMFLGKALEESGSKSPYVEGQNPKSERIEDQIADRTTKDLSDQWSDMKFDSDILKLKDWRYLLKSKIIVPVRNIIDKPGLLSGGSIFLMLYIQEIFLAATEAKMWLGIEMGRLNKLTETENSNVKA